VTLVMPTMNEVEGLKWFMPQLQQAWYDELIIIDGGSTDGTVEYCREHGYPLRRQSERGLPPALSEAFALATKEVIVTASPDGNCKPEHIPEMVSTLVERNCDLVICSRYFGGARSYDDDTLTGFGNRMFTHAVNLLFRARYTDTLGIFRAYRREAIERMRLIGMHRESWLRRKFINMNSIEFGGSMRAAKLRLKIAEISGDEPKRLGGVRKLSIWNNGMGALFQLIAEVSEWKHQPEIPGSKSAARNP
jgi:glycosyltransferase involved in cell wall biosynthesis